ncbi:helix-turn-helix domain-containing protein [Conexibacter arvalis]|uniref:Transcriptional regulator with XRE-family HTH domain n=1 Tax=Conexibacter arvalis TaxID=912552 RepID=A0A840IIT7_9ACTN|nr:helix-turn-helix transcriptional regulator [Conexibacter arvalis]MBB4663924.1 transcriptional regulator with XRE-family HTH domain [Conexibacter arvalis]
MAVIHSPEHVVLGRALREFRARRGLSQESFGFSAGMHRNYVGAIERGEVNPTFKILLKLAGALEAPLSDLIRLYEDRIAEGRSSTR